MKFYSEKLNKIFDTPEALNKAENEAKEKENRVRMETERKAREEKEQKEKEAAERKALAEKVEEARKAMVAAQKAYNEVLQQFIDKYHTYHYSTNNADEIPTLYGLFDQIFSRL